MEQEIHTPNPDDVRLGRDRAAEALEIARLANLDPLDYDRERQAAAERIGCRVGTLDEQVKAARPQSESATGRGVALAEVEPWPEAVETEALLTAIANAIRSHVILPQTMADAVTLWCAHTWVYSQFQHTPRLSVTSPAKRCGKSTLLDLLRALSCRPLKADSISASGVFRTVEALAPLTLLIDEADTFLSDNEELRGILNSGFEASGQVIRVVEVKDEWQPIRFATFAPVALAGIGAMPGTLEDRALPIVLQRKAASESVTRMRAPGARDRLQDLARKLARWAQDRGSHLNPDPTMPLDLGDREADISVPLVAIADDAGPVWSARARKALLDVYGRRMKEEGTLESGALLLADIKTVFSNTKSDRIASEDLCRALADMEERPWPEWKQGKAITPPQLARALKPFGPRPGTIRMASGATPKGYYASAFGLVWERYLPPAPAPSEGAATKSRHTATTEENCGLQPDFEAPHDDFCGGKDLSNTQQKQSCGGVAAPAPPYRGEGGVAAGNGVWEGTL
jgi:putative DNA primase/helicase